MANAKKDGNRNPTLLAALNTDGSTPVNVLVTGNSLKVSDGVGGADNGFGWAKLDANRIPVLLGVSSADLTTVIEVYADVSGNLLVKST